MTARRAFLFVVFLLCFAGNALAVDYYADTAGGNWTTNTTWRIGSPSGLNPPPGVYPGVAAGDHAFVTTSVPTVTVTTVIPNPVQLTQTCGGCVVDVQSGGRLQLDSSSLISGTSATLRLSGGTITNLSSLSIGALSIFDWAGGLFDGAGTTTVQRTTIGPGRIAVTSGATSSSGATISVNGEVTYTGGSLAFNDGTNVTVNSAGLFDLQTITGISTSGAASSIVNNGTFRKSGGAFGTNIDVPLHNNNLVEVTIGALVISNGTHSGDFDADAGTLIEFAGTHTITGAPSTFSGGGYIKLTGAININTGATFDVTDVSFQPGTINGPGTLDVRGTVTFNDGYFGNGLTVNLLTGSSLDFLLTGNSFVHNGAHIVNNTSIDIGTGPGVLYLNNGGHITNNVGSSLTFLGDHTIGTDGVSNPRIDNGGTIFKSGGAGLAVINAAVNNAQDVTVSSGALELAGGGTSTGTFTVNGSYLAFTTATHLLNGATSSGSGLTKLLSGTLDIGAAGATIGTGFSQAGGTVTGAGDFFITNGWTWSGGTHSGTGRTFNNGSATFTASAGQLTLDDRQLTNSGSITYAPSGASLLSIDNGGLLSNSGTFDLAGDFDIVSNGAGSPLLDNRASLVKSAGSGTAHILAPVNNSSVGVISVNAGTLALNGGGTNTATLALGANTLTFEAGTYNLNAGTSITGSGILFVHGATLVLNTPVSVTNATLGAGAINGDNLTVSNAFVWSGGTMTGPGATTVTTTLTMTGATATRVLDGRTLTMNGTGDYAAGIYPLSLDNGSTFNVGGTFSLADGDILTNGVGSNVISVPGTLTKSSGSGGARIDVPVQVSGTVQSTSGTLIVANGGSISSGSINAANAGNLVDIFGGTFTINGGTMTGNGKFRITASAARVISNVNFSASNVEITNGTLELVGAAPFAINDFVWNGGTVEGPGTVVIVTTGIINNTLPTTIATGGVLANEGTLQYDGNLSVNGMLNNNAAGTMNIIGDRTLGGGGDLVNAGTLAKTGGAGTAPIFITVTSTGTIGSTSGTLRLGTDANLSGPINAAATVQFSGGISVTTPATITGSGTIAITGGTTTFHTNVTIPNLLLSGGTMDGSGNVTVNGGTWSGGNIIGTGTFTVASGATLTLQGNAVSRALARPFVNDGTVRVAPGIEETRITLSGGITFTNNGLFDLNWNGTFSCICAPTPSRVHNAAGATVIRDNGWTSGAFTFDPPFDNDGIVNIGWGELLLASGGTHSGDFTFINSTGVFTLDGTHAFSASSGIDASYHSNNVVTVRGGTSTFAGTLILGTVDITGTAVVNTTSPATIDGLTLNSGSVLTGTADVAVNGMLTWNGGTVTGSGLLTLSNGIIPAGASPTFLDGRALVTHGFNYHSTPNSLTLDNGASITHESATFTLFSGTTINVGTGGGSFVNNAIVNSAGSTLAPVFTNTDAVNLNAGTTSFTGGFTQTAGTTSLLGGNLASPFAININGGLLRGTGTITAAVNNSGTVAPGTSPGTLTITGLYTQTSSGTLAMEIGGTTAGTQYDQLVLSQTPVLDGTVDVTLFGGFTPSEGQTFDLVTWPSAPGSTFATENFPTWTPSGSFESSYTPTSYRLIAQGPNGDLRVAQTVSGPVYNGDHVVFTVTVTNDGPDAATGVTLTNTFSGLATFVSAPGCSGTGPVTCNLGTLASGASASITLTLATNGTGTVANSAQVTSSTTDPDPGDNTSNASTNVSPQADLDVSIGESADPVEDGQDVTYSVFVGNGGPDTASGVTVTLSLSGGTYNSISAPGFTCSGSGATRTCTTPTFTTGSATITVSAKAGAASPMSLAATVTSSTHDPDTGNNSSTQFTAIECADAAPVAMEPAPGATNVPPSGDLTWNETAGATYTVYLGPAGSGCTTLFGSTSGGSLPYILEGNTTYEWRIEATRADCPTTSTSCVTFTTGADCASRAPTLLAPTGGATAGSPITFQWSAVSGATGYDVFVSSNDAAPVSIGTSATNSLTATVPLNGPSSWYVIATVEGCGNVRSATAGFNVCNVPAAPLASIVGQASSGQTYRLEWEAVPNAVRYEVDESSDASFTQVTTTSVTGTQLAFTREAASATPFFYRVRAFTQCTSVASGNSPTVRVVIIPLPSKESKNPHLTVPIGSNEVVVHEVFIPGEANQNLLFTAMTDREWLTVSPSSGVIPPQGVTLQVRANPLDLPNGTFTATVIVTITSSASEGVASHATSSVGVPVSISIVTPVTPVSNKPQASQHALVIPTVGHLDGAASTHWQSDIRLTNAGFQKVRYQLTFTPAAGSKDGVKKTTISVDAGATTALDDIIRNWYGLGSLSDGANGSLEILPLDNPEVTSLATVASSRTYNVTANGTLGQFVPAVPLRGFIGRVAPGAVPQILSLQQIAQSPQYRTNVGIVEATGKAATALLTVFSTSGTQLLSLPVQLAGGQQKQLNGILAANGITSLNDGRIEVTVTGGDGKATAYASVVDNNTNDPLLVSGVPLDGVRGSRYVLPGVADLQTGNARWRTDMRLFNADTAPQPVTLRFFPMNGAGEPLVATTTLQPRQVQTLDDVVRTLFNTSNVGGAVHVDTTSPATLIVTGRTYNSTEAGTFGQFINAVTPEQATAKSGRTLHILQVEDSTRYRTNIGVVEVTGKPVTVELQVVLPDSKATPTLRVDLAANEFRQFSLIRSLGIGNVYNARIAVRVIDGDGRVTAYGSIIDETTQDPTYVPAQ
ncbi:MAG TPA: hypothetical protein VGF48_03035 [Thermoanaerobaculia bacterium]|jgi:uncharacterized repeat protein (TIGR01451 family)